jgi:hypothetical protein
VETLARADATRQDAFAATLVAKLQELGAAGVLLDFNEHDPPHAPQFTALYERSANSQHQAKLE